MEDHYEPRFPQDWDTDVTERLDDAGASDAFLRVFEHDHTARHSVRELVNKLPEITEENIRVYAGDFAQALWHGDIGEAWYRADLENSRIMSEVFTKAEVQRHIGDDPEKYKSGEYW